MKTTKPLIFSLAFLLGTAGTATVSAHDFSVKMKSGNELFCNVLDTLKNTVEMTYEGEYNRPDHINVIGELMIPETVRYQDKTYTVVAVGAKAFSGCNRITSVRFPSSVASIGEFSFEGCDSLSKVIFPAGAVEMEKNSFWGCTSISSVSFGSDWTAVDLGIFSWTEALESVTIPAKVNKLSNLRAVKSLRDIEIDENNRSFASIDGLLYSKKKTALYACPVSHKGQVIVPEGVEEILRGAFLGCGSVESVKMPSSLSKLSFDEFFGVKSLKYIVLQSEIPVQTISVEGKAVFALKLSPEVLVYVPKAFYANYGASLWNAGGSFTSIDGKTTIECEGGDLLQKKQVKKANKNI